MMHCNKVSSWFGILQPYTTSLLFGATCRIEGAQGGRDPIELTRWSKLCDKYKDVFSKPTGVPTHCKFTHCIDQIDKSL